MEEPDLTQKKRYLSVLKDVIKAYRSLMISVNNEDFIKALEFSAARLEAEIKREESLPPGVLPGQIFASATFHLPLPGSPPRYKISEEPVCAPQPLARGPLSPESPEDPLPIERKKIR